MEVLAYIAVVLAIIAGGVWLSFYLGGRYGFSVFSGESIGIALLTIVAWLLAYFYYEPGSADALWVEIVAGLFVFVLGIGAPLWLLVRDIRGSNLFWGFLAFIYQFLVVSTVVLLAVLLVLRLSDND